MYGLSRARGEQPASTSGFGIHYTSPIKKRKPARKTKVKVTCPFAKANQERLNAEYEAMLREGDAKGSGTSQNPLTVDNYDDEEDGEWEPINAVDNRSEPNTKADPQSVDSAPTDTENAESPDKKKRRRSAPNEADIRLSDSWKNLVPTLVEDYLVYMSNTVGRPMQEVTGDIKGGCLKLSQNCIKKTTEVICLYHLNFIKIQVTSCSCKNIGQTLVQHGLFPTAPSDQVRMAFSIGFLISYAAFFARSFGAVSATANALNDVYTERGYYLLDGKGEKYKEPFRRGLSNASQWFDVLRVMVEAKINSALEASMKLLPAPGKGDHRTDAVEDVPMRLEADTKNQQLPVASHPPSLCYETASEILSSSPTPPYHPELSNTSIPEIPKAPTALPFDPYIDNQTPLKECSQLLQDVCPACFGGNKFGRSLQDGGDFQISTDGNFHHRHLISGGQGIPFHKPKHIVPKEFVDHVGQVILQARPREYKPKVPDSAVEECKNSHEAANNGDKKAYDKRYDERGWMSLICRHDIPLFFATIDTPGEQQKYAIALLLYFFAQIPRDATVTELYDINCVQERSIRIWGLLPPWIIDRVLFVTTAMHAYGHQWACQLVYNPRLCKGVGLTDGEGVERTWSRLTKLIPITRSSSCARRIWLTDRQLSAIARDLRDDLGDWIARRQKSINTKTAKARGVLAKCSLTIPELQEQWGLQKKAQLSLRAHAPARLKAELNSVLVLQGELDTVEKAIESAKKTFRASPKTPEASKAMLKDLQEKNERLIDKVEAIYVSLNIPETFPEMKNVNLEFVRTLLMARDLKINIRKRAVGSFFEWERLDQAVGGRNQALGTKLHQQTRKAIAKRTPALNTSLRKFNKYCERLSELYDPTWNIPLPRPLPVTLGELRDNSTLMEDVWITDSQIVNAPWYDDPDVRAGIRAMHVLDRCLEEQRRLGLEADNLCRWFGRQLGAVELALRFPENQVIGSQLAQYRDHLLHIKSRWSGPLASALRFNHHVDTALQDARVMTGVTEPTIYRWIKTVVPLSPLCDEHPSIRFVPTSTTAGKVAREEKAPYDAEDAPEEDEVEDVHPLLADGDNDEVEDTSAIEYTESAMAYEWKSFYLKVDDAFAQFLHETVYTPHSHQRFKSWTFEPYVFTQREMLILGPSKELLSDTCLNGSAKILQYMLLRDPQYSISANRCAIFTTFDLGRVHYKATDRNLWRNTRYLEFWAKNIWIVPIHRPRELHWVLAVVYLERKEVHLFDSLAGRHKWKENVQNISVLISRLVTLANRQGYPMSVSTNGWIARPAVTSSVQSNGYDCGLWVLAWITAVLRGSEALGSNITQRDMPAWRSLLGGLVRGQSRSSSY